jgi:hypothetical protein
MTLLLLPLAALASTPEELGPSWAEFSREPSMQHETTKVEIGTLGREQGGRLAFWLRRTVTTDQGVNVGWASSRTCPAVYPALVALRALPVPRFAPPGLSAGPPIVMDGISYSIRAWSDEGQIEAETNVGTSLAGWVEGTLASLRPCWTARLPQRAEPPRRK